MASFGTLPTALLGHIFAYIPDHQTLCTLELTCSEFRELISQDPSFWEALYQCRWKTAHDDIINKDAYIRRHLLDLQVTNHVHQIASRVEEIPDNRRRHDHLDVFPYPYAYEADTLIKRTQELLRLPCDAAAECCWNIGTSDMHDCKLAKYLVRLLRTRSALKKLVLVRRERYSTEAEYLEETAIRVNQVYCSGVGPLCTAVHCEWIRDQLDEMAATIESRVAAGATVDEKLEIVDRVLFEELQFTGNTEDYYNYRNSLLDSTLKLKKGIPMTLAIIYQCVCRRLAILVDIIGLPGHIVVHVPRLNRYVDVFRQGQHLTRDGCERIVNSYRIQLGDSDLEPLSSEQVIYRVTRNIQNCLVHRPARQHFSSRLVEHLTAFIQVAVSRRAWRPEDEERVDQCLSMDFAVDVTTNPRSV